MFLLFLFGLAHSTGYDKLNVPLECSNDNSYCFPKNIWVYWDKEIPEDIDEMISVTKNSLMAVDFTFCFLSDENISNFLGDLISRYSEFNSKTLPQAKSDYIRICLLEKYGGIWIDASTYINSATELESVVHEAVKARAHFVSYAVKNGDFQVLTSFLGASQNSSVMKVYKREYDQVVIMDLSEYVTEVCGKLRVDNYILANRRCQVDVALDLVYTKITHENPKLLKSVLLLPPNRSGMRLKNECTGKECVRYRLLHDRNVRSIPIIKVNKSIRDGKKFYFREGLYLNDVSYNQWKSDNMKQGRTITAREDL